MRAGRLVLGGALLVVAACVDAISPSQPPDDADRCPAPGVGVSIGGDSGEKVDAVASPTRRLVLMGGGAEDDAAATLFAEGAGGGDLVILRATGSLNSYPAYFTTTLAPEPRPSSAVTLLTAIPGTASDPAVLCWVGRAEAVWFAGGSQWDYLGGWPETLHASLSLLSDRGAAVGGTSAGAMVLGEGAFDARLGGVSSAEALSDPSRSDINISYPSFAQPELSGTLVDSHFTERSREGRLLAFLARFLTERGYGSVVGIGLDEGVALVLERGLYSVSTPGEGAAWVYEVSAPVELNAGEPLNLTGVRWIRLAAGNSGVWPIDFDAADGERLDVDHGVVRRGSDLEGRGRLTLRRTSAPDAY